MTAPSVLVEAVDLEVTSVTGISVWAQHHCQVYPTFLQHVCWLNHVTSQFFLVESLQRSWFIPVFAGLITMSAGKITLFVDEIRERPSA